MVNFDLDIEKFLLLVYNILCIYVSKIFRALFNSYALKYTFLIGGKNDFKTV